MYGYALPVAAAITCHHYPIRFLAPLLLAVWPPAKPTDSSSDLAGLNTDVADGAGPTHLEEVP